MALSIGERILPFFTVMARIRETKRTSMEKAISQALTVETPGKVIGLLSVALFSAGLMFAVSASNASFQGSEFALYDPFAPEKVVAAIDTVASAYSKVLSANFIQPLSAEYKIYGENLAWLLDQNGLVYALGFSQTPLDTYEELGQVAGAYEENNYSDESGSFGIDSLYSMLIE